MHSEAKQVVTPGGQVITVVNPKGLPTPAQPKNPPEKAALAYGLDPAVVAISADQQVLDTTRQDLTAQITAQAVKQGGLSPQAAANYAQRAGLEHEVYGSLLYTSLPYFLVSDEVRQRMSPQGRAIFEELEPLVRQGVLGGQEASLEASLEITRRLEGYGFGKPDESLDIRPPSNPDQLERNGKGRGKQPSQAENSDGKNNSNNKEATQPNQPTQEGSSSDSSSQNSQSDQAASGDGGSQTGDAGEEKAAAGGSGTENNNSDRKPGAQPGNQNARKNEEDEAENADNPTDETKPGADNVSDNNSATSEASDSANNSETGNTEGGFDDTNLRDLYEPFSDADLDNVLGNLDRQAAFAVSNEVRRQTRPEGLGARLHKPLTGQAATQYYKNQEGRVMPENVIYPTSQANATDSRYDRLLQPATRLLPWQLPPGLAISRLM